MSTIPPILVKIQTDTAGLKAGLAQAEKGIKGLNDNVKVADQSMTSFTSKLKQVGAALGLAFAGAQVANFAKQSIMAASNMAESVSKVNIVFAGSSEEVLAFAKTAASSLGISNQAALEATGTYGNLFQALGVGREKAQDMSINLVKLAADLSSFNNISVTDSLNALRSGLSGETEPLKRFGIALNEVTLKNEAMAMGFGKITGVMDPAIKSQVIYSLVMKQTALAQGDYERTASGTANTMKTLVARFEDAKVAVGNALMPAFRVLLTVLNAIIPVIEKMGKYFTDNSAALKAYTIIIGAAALAFYGYRAAVLAAKTINQLYVLSLALMRGATLASIASTNGLAASILLLNVAIKANPIGAIITAVILVGVAFVTAYKKFETFRNIIDAGLKIIITGFGYFLGALAKVTRALSYLPGGGVFKGMADGLDQAATSAGKYANALGKVGGGWSYSGPTSQGGVVGGGATGPSAASLSAAKALKDQNAKLLEGYLKDVKDIREKMAKAIADAEEKTAKATKTRIEADLKANEDYKEKKLKLEKDYAKTIVGITKDYNVKIAELQAKYNDDQITARQNAVDKMVDIVKQSIDRLRSAFSAGTSLSVSDAFKESGSVEGLITQFTDKLKGAKDLQENAAALAGLGYSQVFIEEVVKNGPEAGNAIAKALKDASPEANIELQRLYKEVQTISEHGLDTLGKTMNAGGKLATEELLSAYAQVSVDLNKELATINSIYKKDTALAMSSMLESLAEAKANFDEALIEASKDLTDALAESQKNFNEAIEEINKDTKEKMAELRKDLAEIAALMAAIGATKMASEIMKQSPYVTPTTGGVFNNMGGVGRGEYGPSSATKYTPSSNGNEFGSITVNQSFSNPTASPYDMQAAVISAVKYGVSQAKIRTLEAID